MNQATTSLTRTDQLTAQLNTKQRKDEARKKIIIGALILKAIEQKESLRREVVGLLGTLKERDKELFLDLLDATSVQLNP